MVFLGTPHSGALLEAAGTWVETLLRASPYAAPLARLGAARSAGITDLRFGDLVDEDWARVERHARRRHHVEPYPLPTDVACFAVAATRARRENPLHDRVLGDGLVTIPSAFGRHRDPRRALKFDKSRQHIVYGTGHLELLGSPAAYAQMRRWSRR